MISEVHPEILAELSEKGFSIIVTEQFRVWLTVISHLEVPILEVNLLKAEIIYSIDKALKEQIKQERKYLIPLDPIQVCLILHSLGSIRLLPIFLIIFFICVFPFLGLLSVDKALVL